MPGDALDGRLVLVQLADESLQRALQPLALLGDDLAAALPGEQHEADDGARPRAAASRRSGPWSGWRRGTPGRRTGGTPPSAARYHGRRPSGRGGRRRKDARDRDRAGHRDAVRGGQAPSARNASTSTSTATIIVQLTAGRRSGRPRRGSVRMRRRGQEAELHRLARDREGARDDGLRGDHRRGGRQEDHRATRPVRHQQVERVRDRRSGRSISSAPCPR